MVDDIEHAKDRIKHWKAEIEKYELKLEEMESACDEAGTSLVVVVREGLQWKISDAKAYLSANQRQLADLDPDGFDEDTRSLLQSSKHELK